MNTLTPWRARARGCPGEVFQVSATVFLGSALAADGFLDEPLMLTQGLVEVGKCKCHWFAIWIPARGGADFQAPGFTATEPLPAHGIALDHLLGHQRRTGEIHVVTTHQQ